MEFSITKVLLAKRKIQALGRVVLDGAALENAGLKIGDDIKVSYDTESSAILIEKVNEAEPRVYGAPAREPVRRVKTRRP